MTKTDLIEKLEQERQEKERIEQAFKSLQDDFMALMVEHQRMRSDRTYVCA